MFGKSRVLSFLAAAAAFMGFGSMPAPINAGVVPSPTNATYVSRVHRSRWPDSNRDARRRAGIPHGTSGAKLARKAAAGKLGLTK